MSNQKPMSVFTVVIISTITWWSWFFINYQIQKANAKWEMQRIQERQKFVADSTARSLKGLEYRGGEKSSWDKASKPVSSKNYDRFMKELSEMGGLSEEEEMRYRADLESGFATEEDIRLRHAMRPNHNIH
jgi:hypothetical protein